MRKDKLKRRRTALAEALEPRHLLAAQIVYDLDARPTNNIGLYGLTSTGSAACFAGNNGMAGLELWQTNDGAPAGTSLVKDIRPGTTSVTRTTPLLVGRPDGSIFFYTNNGPPTNTKLIDPTNDAVTQMFYVGGTLDYSRSSAAVRGIGPTDAIDFTSADSVAAATQPALAVSAAVQQGPTATVNVLASAAPWAASGARGYFYITNLQDTADNLAAGLKFSYDFDNDGTFDVVDSDNPKEWIPSQYTAGKTSQAMQVRIANKVGASTTYTATLTLPAVTGITAAAPTMVVNEGAQVTLLDGGSTSQYGPIVKWEWDTNYNGSTFVPRLTGFNPVFSAAGLDGPSTQVLALRVTDSAGHTATGTGKIRIDNVAPFLSGTTALAGGAVTVNLSAADPGRDTINQWVINWGDGTSITYPGNPGSVSHAFAAAGNYVITGTATDEDGSYNVTLSGPGSPDPTFGVDGRIIEHLADSTGNYGVGARTVLQPDGKIVTLFGVLQGTNTGAFTYGVLARYNPDGSPDATFGNGGRVYLDLGTGSSELRYGGLTLQPDGAILLIDTTQSFLERFTPDGTPDPTFGYGGRISFANDSITTLSLQTDGRILVVLGRTVLTRLNADGSVDTSFGTGGRATMPTSGITDEISAVLATAAGEILVAGDRNTVSGNHLKVLPFLVTLNADGSVDHTHYATGYTIPSLPNVNSDTIAEGSGLIVGPDGKATLYGGFYQTNGSGPQFLMLLRYNPDGTPDLTFHGTGYYLSSLPAQANSMVFLPDGRMLIGGMILGSGAGVYRLNADGTTDTSFGAAGAAYVPGTYPYATQVVGLQPDGRLVVTSTLENDFEYLRLNLSTFAAPTGTTATFTSGGAVNEGSTGLVRFTNPTGGGPYTYSYDFDDDGVFEIVDSPVSSATVPASNLADGPFTRVVHGRVTSANGNVGDYRTSIQVNNVAPKLSNISVPSSAKEGDTIILTASATDVVAPDVAAGFRYTWRFDRAGGGGSTFAFGSPATFTLPDSGTYTVTVTATDKDGGTSAAAIVTLVVDDLPPTATLAADTPTVQADQSDTVRFTVQADPGLLDAVDGFTYAYDFDNDGTFEITHSSAASATVPASYLTVPGPHVIRGQITDKDGASTVLTTTIQVVAASATFAGPASVNEGGTATVTFAGVAGIGPFKYSYDFNNDGTFEAVNSTIASATVPAAYLADGPFTRVVRGRVTQANGQFTDFATSIQVVNVAPTAQAHYSATSANNTLVYLDTYGDVAADLTAGLAFSYDFDNDGTYEITGSDNPAAEVPQTYLMGRASRTVGIKVADKDGASTAYTVTILVAAKNGITAVAPKPSVLEGGTVMLFDGGSTSQYGPIVKWEWDTNYNGSTFVTRATGQGTVFSAASLDGPGSRSIALRVTDSAGHSATATGFVTIVNDAPLLTGAVTSATGDGSVTLSLRSTDAGSDTIIKWVIDWGDGTTQTVPGNPPSVTHTYAAAGNYQIIGTATDEDGSYKVSLAGVGSVDPAFGANGRTVATESGIDLRQSSLVVQPDGKILSLVAVRPSVAGRSYSYGQLTRYNADGSLDVTFGNGGQITIDGGSAAVGYASYGPLLLQPDGKIIILDGQVPSVLRFTADGLPDPSFGDRGRVPFQSNSSIRTAALQADGKLLVTLDQTSVCRLNADGTIDPSFGDNGTASLPITTTSSYSFSVLGIAATSADRILVVGIKSLYSSSQTLPVLVTLNADGSVDRSHYSAGYATPSLPNVTSSTIAWPYGYQLGHDGKFTVVGSYQSQNGVGPTQAMLLRYNPDGTPDASLNGRGNAVVQNFTDGITMAIQPDGKVVTVPEWRNDTTDVPVYRINPDGTADATFGAGGIAYVPPVPFANSSTGIAVAPDGGIIFAVSSQGRMNLYRLRPDAFLLTKAAGTLSAAGPVNEGSPASVQFTGQTGGGSYTYSYDFDNDGAFEVVDSPSPIATIPAAYLGDGPATVTVRGRIANALGYSDYTAQIAVKNIPPTVALGSIPIDIHEGVPVVLTATAGDASQADAAAGIALTWTVTSGGTTVATGTGPSFTFTPPDNGTYAVTVTANDKDGGSSSASANVGVTNVAPAATFTNAGSVVHGTPGSVSFTNPADVATDLANLTYSYDFNNDGTFEITNSSAATATVPGSYLAANGSHVIRGRIKDKDGDYTDYTTTIVVTNPPPTATFSNSGPVKESASAAANVTFSAPTGGTAPFTYAYDFDNDGIFEITNSTSRTATVPSSYLDDGPTTRTVHGRIKDASGLYSDFTTRITVNNLPPDASISSVAVPLGSPTATLTFTNLDDPSPTDVAAGLRYSFDFDNDGTFDVVDSPSPTTTHTFPGPGLYTVRARVADKDGGYTDYLPTVRVLPALPAATLSVPDTAEGSPSATATLTSVVAAVPYTIAFDLNNDGVFETTDSPSSTATIPASLLVNGPDTKTVRARITDAFGQSSIFTTSFNIINTPPTATLYVPPATEGFPVTISLTSATDVVADASFTYSFDLDNDGTFEITDSPSPSAPVTFADSGLHTVRARVADKDGGSTTYALDVNVTDVAPTATLSGSTASENTPALVSFSSPTDVPADAAAGFTYSYDFDNDGTFEITDSTNPTATVPASYLADNGTRTVHARITDKDGGHTDYTTTVTVTNTAPTASFLPPASVPEGSAGSVTLVPADPSPADTAAGFRYSFDFDDDGTFEIVDSPNPTATIPASYFPDGPATLSVRGRVIDKDGAASPDTTATVTVTNVDPELITAAGSNLHVPIGSAYLLSLAADDPGRDAVSTWFVRWGDGQTSTAHSPTALLPHQYAAAGQYTITTTATDDDGSHQFASSVTVTDSPPTATLTSSVLTPDRNALRIVVTYTGDNPIDATTVGDDDLTVTGPAGAPRGIHFVSATPSSDGRTLVATYDAATPYFEGPWGWQDSGTYTVSLRPSAVSDARQNPTPAGPLGTATVQLTAPNAPDLAPSFVIAPQRTLTNNDLNQVVVKVANAGNRPLRSNKVTTRLYLSTDPFVDPTDKILATTKRKLALKPRASQLFPLTFRTPAVPATGKYYVLLKTDVTGVVAERNERNDVAPAATKITSPFPDLAAALAKSLKPSYGTGTSLPLSLKLRNIGPSDYSGKVAVSILFSADPIADASDTSVLASRLKKVAVKPKGSQTFNLSATIPGDLASHDGYLIIVARPTAVDHNPSNNTVVTPINVT